MKKILVVEDHDDVRENIGEILELADYEVFLAPNGKKGVEIAVRELPDLILCDVMMPELDGFGVLKILRSNKRTKNLPFIFLTAKSEKEDFRTGMGLGADDYITKPFNDVDMLKTIEMRLERSEHIKHQYEIPGGELDRNANTDQIIQKILEDRDERSYGPQHLVYDEGDKAKDLYYVRTGLVKECLNNEYGKQLVSRFCFPGEFLGLEDVLLSTDRRTAAEVSQKSELVRIPREELIRLIGMDREIAGYFMDILAASLRDIKGKLLDFAYASVRKRIADTLCDLAQKHPQSNHGKPTIYLSREDLANKAGTAKETVIRTLSDFKEEGLITIDARKITLTDPEKLRQIPG